MKIGYARVSTTGQNLDAQLEALDAAGVEKLYEDTATGSNTDRPRLQAMIEFAREGDEIVVARLDRFTRSSADLHDLLSKLREKGVTVRFLDNPAMDLSTAHGELLLSILAATASFERRLIIARTEEGRQAARAKGVKFGRPPKIDQTIIDQAKELKGTMPASKIAEQLGISRRTLYRALDS